MLHLSSSFDSSLGRFQLEDYVRELEITVFGLDESGLQHTAGRIAGTQVRWADAELDGESLFDICDSDSQGLDVDFDAGPQHAAWVDEQWGKGER